MVDIAPSYLNSYPLVLFFIITRMSALFGMAVFPVKNKQTNKQTNTLLYSLIPHAAEWEVGVGQSGEMWSVRLQGLLGSLLDSY